jgi:hypothetical protein
LRRGVTRRLLPAASTPAFTATITRRADCGLWCSASRLIIAAQHIGPVTATALTIAAPFAPSIAPIVIAGQGRRRCRFGFTASTLTATATAAFGPGYRLINGAITPAIIMAIAMPAATVITIMPAPAAAMLTIPFMPTSGPIAAMMIAHIVAVPAIIEDIIAIARIPVAIIPATAEAYIIETIAAVAGIIAIERRIRIAIILVIGIAIIIIAKAHIIDTARQADGSHGQRGEP